MTEPTCRLQALAVTDEVTLEEAAAVAVECGVVFGFSDWIGLSGEARAQVLIARRVAQAQALGLAGRDLDAARSLASLDGGRSAARLMAQAAAHGVLAAMNQQPHGVAS